METLYQYNIFNSLVPTEPEMDTTNTLKSKKLIKQKSFKKVHFAENITLEYTYSSDIYDRTPFEDDVDEYKINKPVYQKPIVFNVLDDIDLEIIYNNNNDVRLTIYNSSDYRDDDEDSVIDFDDYDDFDDFDDYTF
ncbi:hypothetical protein BCR32DRAFT_327490 [Anaeromyces robustus]|uniref:Uncharacterized protein n=1 Tax=Anaeromyces robustus TaxID=1754192 RepID=A0A1Y1X577_9FUNG|nr:hypothetical protein BCR32DRAFT_327490 [Anaeromyces robustus]|eukprot:ORX80959.1 hypothetical protein BCR32DRAFT_327490 [Anaeromyces robustus]